MTEQTVREMNAVIGLFHNRTLEKGENGEPDKYILMDACYTTDPLTLGYHSDWNQLMPVVEKLEEGFRIDIYGKACKISQTQWTVDIARIHEKKIMAVFLAVYEAIQWYNKNKQQ